MYKTLGNMGTDSDVLNNPYRGGTFEGLSIMIERQNRDKIINTIFPERRVDDLKAYVSLNMHQIASPRYNRDALGLPPLTQEDTDECLDNSRIVGEDPIWMSSLEKGRLKYYELGLRISDLVTLGLMKEGAIIY